MNTSREEKLILNCLAISRNNIISSALAAPGEAINWDYVIILSKRHGISPLLYSSLSKSLFLECIPGEIFRVLKDSYFSNLYRNTALWKEFGGISDLAKSAEVEFVPFKGFILAHLLYRDIGLRVLADMDIMVKQCDLPKIKAILSNRGYHETVEVNGYLFGKSISPGLFSYIELHLSFVPPRPNVIEIPHLWQRLRTELINGEKIDCLSHEDTFLALILHIRRHTRVLMLKFVYDIAKFLSMRVSSLDWWYIDNLVEKNHIKNCVYFSMYISKELLDIFIPEDIINKFSPNPLIKNMMHFCFNKRRFLKPGFWKGYILRILLFDRGIDLFMYMCQTIAGRRSFK